MSDNIATSKFLNDIAQLLNVSIDNYDISTNFANLVNTLFGIDKTALTEIKEQSNSNAVCEYVSNTKKAYIDNQLSEYSAFPELIGYRNAGYRSYASVPIIIDGKVFYAIEMLSNFENKFSDELLQIITIGAPLIGFGLAYKKEKNKSLKLATYFDAAFSDSVPQLLVSSNGNIIKANKGAMKKFNISSGETKVINILNMDFGGLMALSKGFQGELQWKSDPDPELYKISVSKISDGLLHVVLLESTSQALLKSTLSAVDYNSNMAIIFVDSNFTIRRASKGFGQILGFQSELVLGKSLLEMTDERGKMLLSGEGEKSKTDATGVSVGNIDLVSIGSLPVTVHIVMVKSFYGSVIALVNAEMEKYIETVNKNLENFISSTSDIVMVVDSLGFIRECNISVEHALGYTRDELLGKDIRMLYKDSSILNRDIAYVRNGGKADNSYVKLIKKGNIVIPGTHYVRLAESKGSDASYLILIKELETKTLMDDQIDLLHKQETQLKNFKSNSDLKSEFIYNISHELKTPLTSIIGFSKFLYEGEFGQVTDEEKENIKTIMDEADRLMIIIQQILDATKLDADKVELDFKEVDLVELRNNPSIKALDEAAQKKGLVFSWDVKFDVPKIMADQNRLIQVFVNLIGNAIKFTETGSITVNIAKQSRTKVLLQVIDTGMGISPEDKQKLFRKFYQVPRKGLVKPEGTGTGLGLSITKDIIKLHNGKIKVDSEVGKGSTFWFTLPITQRTSKKKQRLNSTRNEASSQAL